jgi:hypothetical protein
MSAHYRMTSGSLLGQQPTFEAYAEVPPTYTSFLGRTDDTRDSLRALLPLANQSERASLRRYAGPATAYDARVVCTAPVFSSLESCGAAKRWSQWHNLCGYVKPSEKVLGLAADVEPVQFNCSMAKLSSIYQMGDADVTLDSPWSICILNRLAGGLMSHLDYTANTSVLAGWVGERANATHDSMHGQWTAKSEQGEWVVHVGRAVRGAQTRHTMVSLTTTDHGRISTVLTYSTTLP